MRILVTGGTGAVGRCAVARLVENGHQVKVIGRRAELEIEGGEYCSCDINDYAALRGQVEGVEGIVHLAAIPNPAMASSEEIFRVNCAGTFNVYQAAAEEGIGRVVSASSINAFGYNFGVKSFPLQYFAIDEEHPGMTTDPYSFSKQIMEETAAYFWRREGISGVCLRLPFVYESDGERGARFAGFRKRRAERYEELLTAGEEEQREQVERVFATIEELRAERAFEGGHQRDWRDNPDRPLLFGVTNFWTSIDARDSAQAIEKGLLAGYEGSHPLFVNDSHNNAGIESERLLRVFFPEVTGRKRPIPGTEALVSIERARELLDFEPEFSASRMWKEEGE